MLFTIICLQRLQLTVTADSYHRPLNGSTERFYTGPDCCSSSGMRMQSYVPYYIYTKSASGVYVNQFIESEARTLRWKMEK